MGLATAKIPSQEVFVDPTEETGKALRIAERWKLLAG
jgi:hypothetical protein